MNTQFIHFSLPLITTYINSEGIEKKNAEKNVIQSKHHVVTISILIIIHL